MGEMLATLLARLVDEETLHEAAIRMPWSSILRRAAGICTVRRITGAWPK